MLENCQITSVSPETHSLIKQQPLHPFFEIYKHQKNYSWEELSIHVSVQNIKSSLEVVIKSLTNHDLILRDLTFSWPILKVLLIGFKVVFGLEGISMRFVKVGSLSKLPFVYSLSGYSRNAKVAMLSGRQPWVQQIMRNFLILCLRLNPFCLINTQDFYQYRGGAGAPSSWVSSACGHEVAMLSLT